MYSYGLQSFLQRKKLKSNQAINLFLQSQGITTFTAKNHNRVNEYIQNNWTKFATFIDKALKAGLLEGERVKLNYYFDEQREFKENAKAVTESLTPDQKRVWDAVRKYDDPVRFSYSSSFFSKRGMGTLPKNAEYEESLNGPGICRLKKVLPKIEFIANSGLVDEWLDNIKERYYENQRITS